MKTRLSRQPKKQAIHAGCGVSTTAAEAAFVQAELHTMLGLQIQLLVLAVAHTHNRHKYELELVHLFSLRLGKIALWWRAHGGTNEPSSRPCPPLSPCLAFGNDLQQQRNDFESHLQHQLALSSLMPF